jgi:hypothetical protein
MKILAAVLIVAGFVTMVAPSFYNCAAEGKTIQLPGGRTIPMKCLWTARAEMGMGAMGLFAGILLLISRNLESRKFLSLLAFVLGIFVILFPTTLIGVCGNPEMPCASVMKPILLLTGFVMGALGIIGTVWNHFAKMESRP